MIQTRKVNFVKLQSKVQSLGLGVDFVFPLSQEQEQEPSPKSELEFDTKGQILLVLYSF